MPNPIRNLPIQVSQTHSSEGYRCDRMTNDPQAWVQTAHLTCPRKYVASVWLPLTWINAGDEERPAFGYRFPEWRAATAPWHGGGNDGPALAGLRWRACVGGPALAGRAPDPSGRAVQRRDRTINVWPPVTEQAP
jgi:hypothetical protein